MMPWLRWLWRWWTRTPPPELGWMSDQWMKDNRYRTGHSHLLY
jgi:hypothetical protein